MARARAPVEAQREQEWQGPPIAKPAHQRFREATEARRRAFGVPN